MTSSPQNNKSPEEIYLKHIHDWSTSLKIDLHTYFYWKDMVVCPICNEWIIEKAKPEMKA
jgi:hypothetical protein